MSIDPSAAYPAADLRNLVTDDEWERITRLWGPSGVDIADGSAALAATLSVSPRAVMLTPGGCFVAGRYRPKQAATEQVAIPAASPQDRIDRAVMRLNRQAVAQTGIITPVVTTGTPSSTPTAPALLSNTQYVDIPVAQWRARSNGVVDQLVDERRWTGMPYQGAPTGIGVRADTPNGGLWWQTNRSRLVVKSGTGDIVAAEDTGWVALNSVNSFWPNTSVTPPAVRAKNGVGFLAGAVTRAQSALGDGDARSNIIQLPAEYRPSRDHKAAVSMANTSPILARLVIDATDGMVFLEYPNRDVAVSVVLYLSQLSGWPIG